MKTPLRETAAKFDEARAAEAAKTARLRALRLGKEAAERGRNPHQSRAEPARSRFDSAGPPSAKLPSVLGHSKWVKTADYPGGCTARHRAVREIIAGQYSLVRQCACRASAVMAGLVPWASACSQRSPCVPAIRECPDQV